MSAKSINYGVGLFMRLRISFPVLKNGKRFCRTGTHPFDVRPDRVFVPHGSATSRSCAA